MSLLELKGVSKHFGGLRAVHRMDLAVEEGSISGLIGPNGSGKSTLFNLITGMYRADEGTIRFAGREIQRLPMHRIAQRGLVRTFQKTTVFADLSVFENTRIGTFARTKASLLDCVLRTRTESAERAASRARAQEILEFLGLGAMSETLANNLPYGLLRHLEIAIALAAAPRLLLLDEPAAGLNGEETQALMRSLRQIRERGITLLLVEHDMKLVMNICDRITVINEGQKIAEGLPLEMSQNPDVVRVYLGEELEL
jgi:branched-chain amino acid transport system ATP-binding protein